MATVEPETTPTPNPPPTEEEKTESNQEVANPEHYIKHPLQNRWALWFFKNDKSKTWQANLRLISKFDTVEDFWALYNHIQLSSNLMPGCDYSLFKDGIEPMWEDEKNKRGGRWLITLNKQQRRSDLDRFWLETLLCLIGESFDDYSDDVCGAVVNVRAKGQDGVGKAKLSSCLYEGNFCSVSHPLSLLALIFSSVSVQEVTFSGNFWVLSVLLFQEKRCLQITELKCFLKLKSGGIQSQGYTAHLEDFI
ncbi:hypothetical protein MG293_003401 [Ovis ammon polii]|uniref:Eukaryotic translation initiation factor 4E n=1 Tax=Ovis ammon polii TaxID=230172 RepID=A0AAD4UIX8_OVIAM|nr:hypothetical protein MG293_003401 [Ovis ammon polii]